MEHQEILVETVALVLLPTFPALVQPILVAALVEFMIMQRMAELAEQVVVEMVVVEAEPLEPQIQVVAEVEAETGGLVALVAPAS
jgi:hypothetical protein